jgi:hypothetical protein
MRRHLCETRTARFYTIAALSLCALIISACSIQPDKALASAGQAEYTARIPFAAAEDDTLLFIDDKGAVRSVKAGDSPRIVQGIQQAQAVFAGGGNYAASTYSGEAYVWGENSHGQLGLGVTGKVSKPERLSIDGETIKDIAFGKRHMLLLTESGAVYACGANDYGQLGAGIAPDALVPVKVAGIKDARAVRCGDNTSFAMTRDGFAYGWGENSSGIAGWDSYSTQKIRSDGVLNGKSYANLYAPMLICKDNRQNPLGGLLDIAHARIDVLFMLDNGDVYSAHNRRVIFNIYDMPWIDQRIQPIDVRLFTDNDYFCFLSNNGEAFALNVNMISAQDAVNKVESISRYKGEPVRVSAVGYDALWFHSGEKKMTAARRVHEPEVSWKVSRFNAASAVMNNEIEAFIPLDGYVKTKRASVYYGDSLLDYSLYQVLLCNDQGEAVASVYPEPDIVRAGTPLNIRVELMNEARALYEVDTVEELEEETRVTLKRNPALKDIRVLVTDSATGAPIANANIYASQSINGRTTMLDGMVVDTDSAGEAVLSVVSGERLRVAAVKGDGASGEVSVFPDDVDAVNIPIDSISHRIQCAYFVHSPGVAGGAESSPSDIDMLGGVTISAANSKTGAAVKVERHQSWLTLPKSVKPGQTIIVRVKGGEFAEPVSVPVLLDDNCNGTADIHLIRRGAIVVFPRRVDAETRLFVTVFNGKGKPVYRNNSDDTYIAFENVERGDYTVALSGVSEPEADCLKNPQSDVNLFAVTVEDGQAAVLRDAMVPAAREYESPIRASFTASSTYASRNSTVDLSLSASADEGVALRQFIVEIPAHMDLTPDSPRGAPYTQYTDRDSGTDLPRPDTIVFDLNGSGAVSFKFKLKNEASLRVPDGRIVSRAWVAYTRGDDQVTEELPPLWFDRTYISLNAPARTTSDAVAVNGEGPANERIELYDGEQLSAVVQIGSDGFYSARVDMSLDGSHTLQARAAGGAGLRSEPVTIVKGLPNVWVDSLHIIDSDGHGSVINGITDAPSSLHLWLMPDTTHTFCVRFGGDNTLVRAASVLFRDGDTVTHRIPLVYDPSSGDWLRTTTLDACNVFATELIGSRVMVEMDAQPGASMPQGTSLLVTDINDDSIAMSWLDSDSASLLDIALDVRAESGIDTSSAPWIPVMIPDYGPIFMNLDAIYTPSEYSAVREIALPAGESGGEGDYIIARITLNLPAGAAQAAADASMISSSWHAMMNAFSQMIAPSALAAETYRPDSWEGSINERTLNLAKELLSAMQAVNMVKNALDASAFDHLVESNETVKFLRDAVEFLLAPGAKTLSLTLDGIEILFRIPIWFEQTMNDRYNRLDEILALDPAYASERQRVVQLVNQLNEALSANNGGTDLGTVDPAVCPSGFVYEAVFSNVLPGVKAAISCADDPRKGMTLEQANPQLTAEDGRFNWDVPAGLWRIHIEKDGYLPSESAILSVPPEHRGLAIPIISSQKPAIESIYRDGASVTIKFTQYMVAAAFSDCVSVNGVSCDIVPLDAEASAADPSVMLARTVRVAIPSDLLDAPLALQVSGLPSYTGSRLFHSAELR